MERMNITCSNCAGAGNVAKYEIVGDGVAQCKEVVCENCGGKGYTIHAIFSIEEAEAILKHCGLDKE